MRKGFIFNYLYICVLFFVSPICLSAQNISTNSTYQRIVERLTDLAVENKTYQEYYSPNVSKSRAIVITRTPNGIINHIGFKLFDRQIIEKHPTPIYHFLERYMLELLLLPNDQDIKTRLKMDNVKINSEIYSLSSIKQGLQKIISDDTSSSSIYMTTNNNRYTVSCMKSNQQLIRISFPIRYELITGFTKLEAEESFYPSIITYKEKSTFLLNESEMTQYKDEKDIFYAFEDIYLTEDFLSTSFYKKNGNKYEAVFTTSYLAESIYNIFNAYHDMEFNADITQSLYGGKTLKYTLPIKHLIGFLRSQRCQIYTGIKENSDTTINGTVMVVNSELGYQHLFTFSVDNRIFEQPKEFPISIKAYCHIPIHNISSLLEL